MLDLALVLGSTLFGAYQGGKQEQAYAAAEAAAGQIKQERLDLSKKATDLALEKTEEQYKTGQESVGFGANIGLRKLQTFGDTAYRKSNMPTLGSIDAGIGRQREDMLSQYQSQMTKLFTTRAFDRRQIDITSDERKIAAETQRTGSLAGLGQGGAFEGAASGFLSTGSLLLDELG